MEYRVMLFIKHEPDKYMVKASIYDESGKLISEKEYNDVRQIVIKGCEVRISAQLSPNPFTLVIAMKEPKIELRYSTLIVGG